MDDPSKPPAYNYGAIPQREPGYPAPPPYNPSDPSRNQQAYPPPPPPPQPQPMPTATTTIITQPGPVYLNVVYRENPVSMVCPHCQAHIVTATSYEDGTVTWIAAGGLCLIGCWLGCCLIPFCVDGCKDVVHSCPNCHARLGVFRRI